MKNQTFLQVQIKGLPPEGIRVAGEVTDTLLDLPPPEDRVSVAGPFRIDLQVTVVIGAVVVAGTAAGVLRCRCDRCLTYFTCELPEIPVSHTYLNYEEDVLDLTEDVREDILLAFPARNLCSGECQGLCPECGQNLNVRDCGCHRGGGSPSAWGALDSLDLGSGKHDPSLN